MDADRRGRARRSAWMAGAWLCASLAGASGTRAAEEPPESTLDLTLAGALKRAALVSQDRRIAASQVTAAEAQLVASRSAALPQVNADFSYTRTIRTPFEVPDGGIPGMVLPWGMKNTWVGGFDIAQPLYAGGRIRAGVEASRQSVAVSRAQAVEVDEDVKSSVVGAYLGAVLAQRLAEITRLSAEQVDLQLRESRLRREAGNASDLDVSRAEVERENFEPERVAALNDADLSLHRLMQILNLPAGTKIRLTDGLSASSVQPLAPAVLEGMAVGALERRASLVAANRSIAVQQAQEKTARAALLPTVKLSARLGAQAFPVPVMPVGSDWLDDWNVGFSIRVPVLDWGQRSSQIAVAREQVTQSTLQRDRLVYTISLDVEQGRAEVSRALALLSARTRTAAQAEKNHELTKLSYSVGSASYLQLTDARSSLQKARANEVQAVHDYYIALVRLQRAAGIPIDLSGIGASPAVEARPTAASPTRTQ